MVYLILMTMKGLVVLGVQVNKLLWSLNKISKTFEDIYNYEENENEKIIR